MGPGRSLVGRGRRHRPVGVTQKQHVQSLRLRPCLVDTQVLQMQVPLHVLTDNNLGPLLDRGGALLAQEVIATLVVHLHAGEQDSVALCLAGPLLILEELRQAPGDNTSRGIRRPPHHGVGLPAPCLPIAEYTTIVPLQKPTEHPVSRRLKHPLLRILGVEHLLERELEGTVHPAPGAGRGHGGADHLLLVLPVFQHSVVPGLPGVISGLHWPHAGISG
mmetsp:Transcript_108904/g.249888  ORF Transcript_108904/g.249888 Transcript_108904/m.249888 type:complete len:219 (+) Transcript_108904:840-1496(+)